MIIAQLDYLMKFISIFKRFCLYFKTNHIIQLFHKKIKIFQFFYLKYDRHYVKFI